VIEFSTSPLLKDHTFEFQYGKVQRGMKKELVIKRIKRRGVRMRRRDRDRDKHRDR
jgi:hypothetical protein